MSTQMASLPDQQNSEDHRKIRIDQVGVKGLRYPIQVKDKAHSVQNTVAQVAMTVDLPHHFKGTHMSRFVEVLNSHGSLVHVENINEILKEMQTRIHAEAAHITLEFPYFIEKKAPVSHSKGLVDYQARFDASVCGNKTDFILTVIVPVTTLCPCSKAISDYGAHNQRGYVTLAIRSSKTVWIEDAIALIESCASSEIFSLLKRTDEKYVTERAYDHPVFVEDLVRNIAVKLNDHPDITWYKVEVENVESIHNHSAYACIIKAS